MEGVVADAVVHVALGAAFLAVGLRLASRRVWHKDRLAMQSFAAWWLLYGALNLVAAMRLALVTGGFDGIALFMALFSAQVLLAFFALGGLASYMLYLWRGHYVHTPWLFGGLGAMGVAAVAILYGHGPAAVAVTGLRTEVVFMDPLSMTVRWALIGCYYVPLLALGVAFAAMAPILEGMRRERAVQTAAILFAIIAADVLAFGRPAPGWWAWTIPVLRLLAAALALRLLVTLRVVPLIPSGGLARRAHGRPTADPAGEPQEGPRP